MLSVVLLLLTLPVAAGLVCLRAPLPLARAVTAVCGVACFGLVLALVPAAAHRELLYLTFLRVDALSTVFLMATGFLYAAVAVYSIGYLARGGHGQNSARYSRRFWLGLNLFAWAMLAAPLMGNLALLWVAIEITTVISALLVAIEDTAGAAEAAWKYVLIASAGLGLALLATIFAYYAGAQVLGQSYDLAFAPLAHVATRLPHTPVQLAFVLAVLGFGTKMGLVPVHTWLPDAHSEAPTPVSALLSGSLLAISFYAILRYYQVAAAALGPRFPRDVLLVFGVASLLLAALYLFGQRDIKRLLAYSSVEHMGILAIGVSFGAPIALAGVLLHVLAHAAAKGNAFMGAGVIVTKFGTKRITAGGAGGVGGAGGAGRRDGDLAGPPGHGPGSAIRGVLDALPWSGPLFLFSILALGAMPPFGIFRSEFEIVAGGFATSSHVAAAILIIGVTVAFFGLAASTTPMLMLPRALVRRPVAEPALAVARAGGPAAVSVTGPAAAPVAGPGDRAGRARRSGRRRPGLVAGARAGRAERVDGRAGGRGRARADRPRRAPARRTERTARPRRQRTGHRRVMPATVGRMPVSSVPTLWDEVTSEVAAGRRFADLFATACPDGLLLSAQLAGPGGISTLETMLPVSATAYPALTPRLGAAFWYEREIHDLFGVVPEGHPRLDPLILPQTSGRPPRPGAAEGPGRGAEAIDPDPRAVPSHVVGPGLFTIPHGPVRSGVVESVEYLVETPGEEIPHLNMRIFYKHRGIEKRFDGQPGRGRAAAGRTGRGDRLRGARAGLLPRA